MPSTALTRGLLSQSQGANPSPALAACQGAVLINVGRGDVVVPPTIPGFNSNKSCPAYVIILLI
eukprot:6509106-Pyramimonas_sp.AAC.1